MLGSGHKNVCYSKTGPDSSVYSVKWSNADKRTGFCCLTKFFWFNAGIFENHFIAYYWTRPISQQCKVKKKEEILVKGIHNTLNSANDKNRIKQNTTTHACLKSVYQFRILLILLKVM